MSKEAMKLALEALEDYRSGCQTKYDADKAITAIKEALAQPEQEPAVFLKEWSDWRDMVVVNIMRHGNIDKHLARELANHFQSMTPQPKEPEQEPVAGDEITRAWLRLDKLPQTMMHGPQGLFGPIPASTSAWVTTSKSERDYQIAQGHHMLEVYTTPPQRKPLTDWIDPNDKAQERFLPNIGEPVLFCHEGKTYYGKHNGGSFQHRGGITKQYFNTWECRWMRLPAAHGIKE